MAPVEERTTAREVAAQRLGRLAADRDDPFLVSLAEAADEPVLEVDAAPLERHRLRDAQARAVEELGERAVAEVARLRAGGRLDEPLGLRRRERARKPARAARKVEVGGRVVAARAEERLVAEERAQRRRAPRDRRGREPVGAQLGEIPLEVVGGCPADRLPEPGSDGGEVAPVGLDGPRSTARGEQGEKPFDLRIVGSTHPAQVRRAAPGSYDRGWLRS